MSRADDEFAIPIVALEEMLKGWLKVISRSKETHRQVDAYERLARLFEVFGSWEIIRYTAEAAEIFDLLRAEKVRIGTMDLRIAAIALSSDDLLLTANIRDFEKVPNLRIENWLV